MSGVDQAGNVYCEGGKNLIWTRKRRKLTFKLSEWNWKLHMRDDVGVEFVRRFELRIIQKNLNIDVFLPFITSLNICSYKLLFNCPKIYYNFRRKKLVFLI